MEVAEPGADVVVAGVAGRTRRIEDWCQSSAPSPLPEISTTVGEPVPPHSANDWRPPPPSISPDVSGDGCVSSPLVVLHAVTAATSAIEARAGRPVIDG